MKSKRRESPIYPKEHRAIPSGEMSVYSSGGPRQQRRSPVLAALSRPPWLCWHAFSGTAHRWFHSKHSKTPPILTLKTEYTLVSSVCGDAPLMDRLVSGKSTVYLPSLSRTGWVPWFPNAALFCTVSWSPLSRWVCGALHPPCRVVQWLCCP